MGVQKFNRKLLVQGQNFPEGDSGGAVESVNGQTGEVVLTAADVGALPEDHTVNWDDVGSKPDFAPVATSGNYADLTGTPDLSGYATVGALSALEARVAALETAPEV